MPPFLHSARKRYSLHHLPRAELKYLERDGIKRYAKTLWAVQRPPHADVAIKAFAKMKPPQFFIYAKDKTQEQVEPRNDSIVNKLFDIIPDKRMRFTAANLGKFDYKVLMRNPIVSIDPRVIEKFKDLDARKNLSLSYGSNEENYAFFRTTVRCELYAINPNVNAVCDMLVAHFFRDKKSKSLNTFWLCYGDIVFQNIRNNIKKDYIQCSCCGKRFWRTSYKNQICEACQPIPVEFDINSMVEKVCSDCGKHFFVKQMARRTHRCEACTAKARKASVARSVEKFRAKL